MFRRMLIGLQFSLSFVIFLKTGLTSEYFKTAEKKELDRELLKLRYMNRAMTCLFPLMIGSGMSVVWDAFFVSLFISSKFCSNEIKLKLNFGLFILEILSLAQILLEWCFYFLMVISTIFSPLVKNVKIF